MKRLYLRLFAVAAIMITLALLVETFILRQIDKKAAYRVSRILVNQVVNNINTNRRDAYDLYESLKDDYKIRAQSVAYILDSKPDAELNVKELKKISSLLLIDEINIFDESGMIYSGSVPQYYGMNFDSGEQISYFKPMLSDKKLTMCQDITPNTSMGKQMMYAMTWNETGTKMIQIGIEPFRRVELLRRGSVSSILKEMPVYNGSYYFIADVSSKELLAVHPENESIKNLTAFSFPENLDLSTFSQNELITRIDFKNYYTYVRSGDLLIGISYSVNANIKNFFITMHLIIIYLIAAALTICISIVRRAKSDKEKLIQYNILSSMSKIYYSMHLINLDDNTVIEYSARDFIKKISSNFDNAEEMMKEIISKTVSSASMDMMQEFTDISTVKERLTGKKIISVDFISIANIWYRASFITIENENNLPKTVFFTIQNINEQKKKENVLFQKSTTDELTGCYNRRAYEEDFKKLKLNSEFVYIEFDVNGLKPVNDMLGHEAGDEIIKSAAKCMKQAIGEYGKLYRTGGDEFVALLNCNSRQQEEIISKFNVLVDSWSGELVKVMSVSYGCVFSKEQKWGSILHIAKEADRRMYRSKSEYYSRSGYDRRSRSR